MTTPALTYGISARVVAPGVSRAECRDAAIEFDTSTGQTDALMGPAELLVSAFAACVLKNVERFSTMLPFRYSGASIAVEAMRQASPPRMSHITYRLTVVTDEPASRVELLHKNIARFGTIYNTLAEVCEITGSIEAVPPAA